MKSLKNLFGKKEEEEVAAQTAQTYYTPNAYQGYPADYQYYQQGAVQNTAYAQYPTNVDPYALALNNSASAVNQNYHNPAIPAASQYQPTAPQYQPTVPPTQYQPTVPQTQYQPTVPQTQYQPASTKYQPTAPQYQPTAPLYQPAGSKYQAQGPQYQPGGTQYQQILPQIPPGQAIVYPIVSQEDDYNSNHGSRPHTPGLPVQFPGTPGEYLVQDIIYDSGFLYADNGYPVVPLRKSMSQLSINRDENQQRSLSRHEGQMTRSRVENSYIDPVYDQQHQIYGVDPLEERIHRIIENYERSRNRSRGPRGDDHRDKSRDLSRDYVRDKSRDELRNYVIEKSRDDGVSYSREKSRDETRNYAREKSQDDGIRYIRDKSRDETRTYTRDKSRDESINYAREKSRDDTRSIPSAHQSLAMYRPQPYGVPYPSENSRSKSRESRSRDQSADFERNRQPNFIDSSDEEVERPKSRSNNPLPLPLPQTISQKPNGWTANNVTRR